MNVERMDMEATKIAAALKATIDPNEREKAEAYLSQIQQIIGFAPTMLQIVVSEQIECPVRQAGTIYLKNLITGHWDEKKDAAQQGIATVATIHEQDRHLIRESIVEAIIHSPEVIRVQLAVCVSRIIKVDFPDRWPTVIDKIVHYLNTKDCQAWMGVLLVLHQLVKAYEFKKPEEREPLVEVMKIILPIIYDRMISLMPDQSQEANYLQKMVLKIFYALVQFSLNLNLMSLEEFTNWMEIVRQIVDRPVPQETLSVDEEDRPNLVWWKCKKWAIRLMTRIFDRYGNPGQVSAEYNQFAEFYLKTFVSPSTQTVLNVLDAYRRKDYISPRVLFQALSYLQAGVSHSFSWKIIKPHFMEIISDVIFPLASHDELDQNLWDEDPQEYIRTKYDLLEELIDPSSAAIGLLSDSVKRKDVLAKVVQFICQILNNSQSTGVQLDGALHMIGALAPNLMKKKVYKNELENMLVSHVFPRFQSQEGYLRSRACWCIQNFSQINYKSEDSLYKSIGLVLNAFLTDSELPVKVEAALAMQLLLDDQPKIEPLIETQIKPIILTLLKLIAETENDDLTNVAQQLISTYTAQIVPIAVEIAQHLASIFTNLLETEDGAEDKAITAIGVLNTLEAVMEAVEDHPEITTNLETVIVGVIRVIIGNSVMEFFEEAFSLISSLTVKQISPICWELFKLMYDVFSNDGADYFTDMMPALHNYVTVDCEAFLSDAGRLEIVLAMCKQVLTADMSEDDQCHAAKLLEVLVLQFKGKLDPMIRPLCELMLGRLAADSKSSELRTMCLQVLIAVLHYNPNLMISTLQTFQSPDASMPLVDLFVKQWLCDTDYFLGVHDRKMYLIGLSILIGMPDRPAVMHEMSEKLVPACLTLYDGLQKAYELKAKRETQNDEDSDSGEEEPLDADALASDEDEIGEESQQYLEQLAKGERDSGNDDEYSDGDFIEETDLESYETVLDGDAAEVDEYVLFKDTLLSLQATEPQWYSMLIGRLTDDQTKGLQKVFSLADQRKAAAESKKIDQTGGYQFSVQQIPVTFNFSGNTFG